MHERALLGQLDDDDRLHAGVGVPQRFRQTADGGAVGALRQSDQQQFAAGHEHVAALDRRRRALAVGEIGPEEVPAAERAVVLEHVLRQQRLAPPRLGGHAADDDAVAEDDLGVAHEEVVRDRIEVERRQLAGAVLFVRNAADEHFGQRAGALLAQH